MTRKDTIIIAVLINLGLLVVLFTTSLKPSSEPIYAKVTQTTQEKVKPKAQPAIKDPIDQMLIKQEVKPAVEPSKPSAQPLTEEKSKPMLTAHEDQVDTKNLIPVIVRQGDVLEKIAKAHHTTVEEVMKINRLPNTFLKIGQILYIPTNNAEKVKGLLSQPTSSNEESFYVVKNGDNPWTIAVKNQIKVEQLLKLNELDESSAKKLKPGDCLRIK